MSVLQRGEKMAIIAREKGQHTVRVFRADQMIAATARSSHRAAVRAARWYLTQK